MFLIKTCEVIKPEFKRAKCQMSKFPPIKSKNFPSLSGASFKGPFLTLGYARNVYSLRPKSCIPRQLFINICISESRNHGSKSTSINTS